MTGLEDWPDWLPDGWVTGSKRRNDGRVDRFYRSPVSGSTFYSKEEVLRYLNFEKVDGLPPRSTGFVCSNSKHDEPEVVSREDSPLWLPDGWILEIKTRKTGPKAGTRYKCYFDPSNGRRFYSKQEVFRYIMGEQKSTEDRSLNSDSTDDIVAQVECSSDEFPPGWIREMRYKRNSSGLRKDPYYKDPVSGYVFRSKNDAFRFIETGEISRHAFRSKGISIDEKYMIDESSPPITERPLRQVDRCQFASPTSITSNKLTEKIACLAAEEPFFVKSSHETRGIEDSVLSSLAMPPAYNSGDGNIQVNADIRFQIYEHPQLLDTTLKRESEQEEKTNGGSLVSSNSEQQQPEIMNSVDLPPDVSSDIANCSVLSPMMKLSATDSTPCECHVDINKSKMSVNEKSSVSGGQSSQQENGNHVKTQVKRKSQPEGQPCKQASKTHLINVDEMSNMVNAKRVTRSSCRGSLGGARHEKVITNRSSKVIAGHETSSTCHGSPSEVSAKRKTRSSCSGSSSQVSLNLKASISCGGSYSEANTKFETSSSYQGSSSKVSAKRETRSSCRGSSSDVSTKKKTTSSRQSSSTTDDTKALSLPRRASKRLAGFEPDPTANLDVSYQSLRKIRQATDLGDNPSNVDIKSKDLVPFSRPSDLEIPHGAAKEAREKLAGDDPIVMDVNVEGEGSGAIKTEIVKKESPLTSPFGDTWPDPCIEFAFRTLIGDIPVFEDPSTAIDYFREPYNTSVERNTTLHPTLGISTDGLIKSSVDHLNTQVKSNQDCSNRIDSQEREQE